MKQCMLKGHLVDQDHSLLCVSLVAENMMELKKEVADIKLSDVEAVEWRIDHFLWNESCDKLYEISSYLSQELADKVLIYTLRSKKEGGRCDFSYQEYCSILFDVLAFGHCDVIDLEYAFLKAHENTLLQAAHAQQIKVIVSYHDFQATPTCEDLVVKFHEMAEIGGDIVKIACMPHSYEDVVTLAIASQKAYKELDVMLIAISMGTFGSMSRMFPSCFHSILSFVTLGKASAPGQLPAHMVRSTWQFLESKRDNKER